jgi:hypothetical protein
MRCFTILAHALNHRFDTSTPDVECLISCDPTPDTCHPDA